MLDESFAIARVACGDGLEHAGINAIDVPVFDDLRNCGHVDMGRIFLSEGEFVAASPRDS